MASDSKILSIDYSKIDTTLVNFPIAIDLDKYCSTLISDLGTDKLKMKMEVNSIDSFTKLLIHSDTTDGSTTFTDSSDSEHTITTNGDVHHEVDQKKFGDTSIYFDGMDDSLSIPVSNDFVFGVDDFTVDFMLYPIVLSGDIILYTGETTGDFFVGIENGVNLGCGTHGVIWNVKIIHGMSINQWYHVVLTRSAGVVYVYINGVEKGHAADTTDYVSSGAISIGSQASMYYYSGYIDEFRVSKGIARWTSNFTPPNQTYSKNYQCPVEIECWETDNHVIHTKIPSIFSFEAPILTISWDTSWADNTDYVGVTGSTPAKQVWDDDFVAVYHMAQDPTGSGACIFESTTNELHATPNGGYVSEDLQDGLIGLCIQIDTADYLENTEYSTDITNCTLEGLYSPDNTLSNKGLITIGTANYQAITLTSGPDMSNSSDGAHWDIVLTNMVTVDQWVYRVLTTSSGLSELFDNGVSVDSENLGPMLTGNQEIKIGTHYAANSSYAASAKVGEVRISKVVRSDAWIKATNASLKDELIFLASLQKQIFRPNFELNSNIALILGGI